MTNPHAKPRRACASCARLKEKCVPGDENGRPCRRCARLHKDCSLSATRIAKEQRMPTSNSDIADFVSYPTPAQSETNGSRYARLICSPQSHSADSTSVPSETLSSLKPAKRAMFFMEFVRSLNPHLPFLVLPTQDAVELEREAPFTFTACVASAAHRHRVLQHRMLRELLASISTAMIVRGHKSVDLLCCLNILVAWYNYHALQNPQLVNLIFMIQALLTDMGIAKAKNPYKTWSGMTDVPKLIHGVSSDKLYGLTGIRELLSAWYAAAKVAVLFHRLEYPRWSEHLDECLKELEAANNYPADITSIHLIRLYRAGERYLATDSIKPSPTFPIRTYIHCFQDDLQRVRSALPPAVAINPQFELHLQALEMVLFNTATSSIAFGPPAQVLEALHAFLAHLKNLFDLYLSQPAEIFPSLPLLDTGHISYALEALGRLNFIQYEGWDLSYVRTSCSFITITDRVMDKFEEVFLSERDRFPENEASRFAIYGMKIRQTQKWYKEKIANETKKALDHAQAMSTARNENTPSLLFASPADAFGFGDFQPSDDWWFNMDQIFAVQGSVSNG